MKTILFYSILAYFAILLFSQIYLLKPLGPPQAGTVIASSQTTLSPTETYLYTISIIALGFAGGYVAIRVLKSPNKEKLRQTISKGLGFYFLLLIMSTSSIMVRVMDIAVAHLFTFPFAFIEETLLLFAFEFLFFIPAVVKYPGQKLEHFNKIGIFIGVMSGFAIGTSLMPIYSFVLLGGLAIYDIVAVFATKHMQKMVMLFIPPRGTGDRQKADAAPKPFFLFPAFIFEGDIQYIANRLSGTSCKTCGVGSFQTQTSGENTVMTCNYCGRRLEGRNGSDPHTYSIKAEGDRQKAESNSEYLEKKQEASRTQLLGLGDIIIPGIVIAAVGIRASFTAGLLAAIGAAVGVIANMLVLKKAKRGLPALPLIFISELLFYLIAMVI
jgi:presenilin-like A22 family membrane protease